MDDELSRDLAEAVAHLADVFSKHGLDIPTVHINHRTATHIKASASASNIWLSFNATASGDDIRIAGVPFVVP